MFLIWSFKHRQWWGPNREGYTPHLEMAGRYYIREIGEILEGNVFGENIPVLLYVAQAKGAPTVPGLWGGPPENAEIDPDWERDRS